MDDHIKVVERSARNMKEVIRIMVSDTPFRRVPKSFAKRSVEAATRNLNSFFDEGRMYGRFSSPINRNRSPRIDARKCPVSFGARAKTFEDNGWIRDSNMPIDSPSLALGP